MLAMPLRRPVGGRRPQIVGQTVHRAMAPLPGEASVNLPPLETPIHGSRCHLAHACGSLDAV